MTILELLVVIAILGLLATLGSIQVLGYLDRAKTDTSRLQLRQLAMAIEVFQLDLGRPPTTDEGLDALLTRPDDGEGWRGPYLRDRAIFRDAWGNPFQYTAEPDGSSLGYEIITYGADGKPGGSSEAADISNHHLD